MDIDDDTQFNQPLCLGTSSRPLCTIGSDKKLHVTTKQVPTIRKFVYKCDWHHFYGFNHGYTGWITSDDLKFEVDKWGCCTINNKHYVLYLDQQTNEVECFHHLEDGFGVWLSNMRWQPLYT